MTKKQAPSVCKAIELNLLQNINQHQARGGGSVPVLHPPDFTQEAPPTEETIIN